MIDYDGNGKPIGVTFGINTPQGAQGFLLPANIEGVLKVFAKQKVKPDREQGEDDLEALCEINDSEDT